MSGDGIKFLYLNGDNIVLNGATIPSINFGVKDLIVIKSNKLEDFKNTLEEYYYRQLLGAHKINGQTDNNKLLNIVSQVKDIFQFLKNEGIDIKTSTDINTVNIWDILIRNQEFTDIISLESDYYNQLSKEKSKELHFKCNDYIATIESYEMPQEIKETRIESKPWMYTINGIIDPINDKVIWAHPGIGKTEVAKYRDDVIDFDTVYKKQAKKELKGYPLNGTWADRKKWHDANPGAWENKVVETFEKAISDPNNKDKFILVSDTILLEKFGATDKINKIVNLSSDEFQFRQAQRKAYDVEQTNQWKQNIDNLLESIKQVSPNKVVSTSGYMSDILPDENKEYISLKSSNGRVVLQTSNTEKGISSLVRKVILQKKAGVLTATPVPTQIIISGGQTGVDTLGLEVAYSLGYTTGGTAPTKYFNELHNFKLFFDALKPGEKIQVVNREGQVKEKTIKKITIDKDGAYGYGIVSITIGNYTYNFNYTSGKAFKGSNQLYQQVFSEKINDDIIKNQSHLYELNVQQLTEEQVEEYKKKHKTEKKPSEYTIRTYYNVKNSNGTVYFTNLDLENAHQGTGYWTTLKAAKSLRKPFLINPTGPQLRAWLIQNNIKILNIAGRRASGLDEDTIEKTKDAITYALSKDQNSPNNLLVNIFGSYQQYWTEGATEVLGYNIIEDYTKKDLVTQLDENTLVINPNLAFINKEDTITKEILKIKYDNLKESEDELEQALVEIKENLTINPSEVEREVKKLTQIIYNGHTFNNSSSEEQEKYVQDVIDELLSEC